MERRGGVEGDLVRPNLCADSYILIKAYQKMHGPGENRNSRPSHHPRYEAAPSNRKEDFWS